MSRVVLLIVFFALPASANEPNSIAGRASVITGDTVEIHGQRVRLFGINVLCAGQHVNGQQGIVAAAVAPAEDIDAIVLDVGEGGRLGHPDRMRMIRG